MTLCAGLSLPASTHQPTSCPLNDQKMPDSAYKPLQPAKRPGRRPSAAPAYRVLVHRHYADLYARMAEAIGLKQAQQFWDHIATTPEVWPKVGNSCILRGRPGLPQAPGWSRTIHFELSSMARVDYQYHKAYKTSDGGDPHRVVAILTVSYSSH
jgi:hypothetical protein